MAFWHTLSGSILSAQWTRLYIILLVMIYILVYRSRFCLCVCVFDVKTENHGSLPVKLRARSS
jgi:hypothetical protein